MRVAMLVANDLHHDSRVQKTALTVASFGHHVTVFGLHRGNPPVILPGVDIRLFHPKGHARGQRQNVDREVAERKQRARELKRAVKHPERYEPRHHQRNLDRLQHELRAIAELRRTAREAKTAAREPKREPADVWGPPLIALNPDVIHIHDHHPLRVGVEIARKLGARVIYDAHEYLAGRESSKRRGSQEMLEREREYAPRADAVITVGDRIADLLEEELGLNGRPYVVRNAPRLDGSPARPLHDGDGQLVVYSGVVGERRGIDIALRAVAPLGDVRLALVAQHDHSYMRQMLRLADDLGMSERLVVAPLVPVDQVVSYLSTATVGIFTPRDDGVSHVVLPNKVFEYLHAGLPIVASDLGEIGRFVTENNIGEVCEPGDVESCTAAIRKVISNPRRYVENREALIREWSWEAQEETLRELYERVLMPTVSAEGFPLSLG